MQGSAKVQEWRAHWTLPLVSLLGVAGSGIAVYPTGVFMGELTHAFGWTKTQYTSAMTIQLAFALCALPFVGRAVDRFGPRAVALTGLVPTIVGTAMLGLANGQLWQWWLLSFIQSCGAFLIIPPVWMTAVVGQLHASRGLALAVALAGIGVGTALWPMLAAYYIQLVGWRLAYLALGLTWGAAMIPLTLLFFFGASDRTQAKDRVKRPAPPYLHHLTSRTFLCLAISGGLFVLVCQAMTLHLVPILRATGMSLSAAAGLAGVAGLCSILGRLVTGLLIDIVPTRPFGVAVFLLPGVVAILLAIAPASFALFAVSAAVLGLAMGAESDVLAYIASRRFDHAIFGSLYSVIQTATAVTSLIGVMLAGALYDRTGSYDLFLLLTIPLTIVGAVVQSLVPNQKPVDVAMEDARPVPLGTPVAE